jgi:GABA permease
VRRYLVVANRTLGGEHLVEKVRECMAAGPCRFHVVVPATDAGGFAMQTEAAAHRAAEQRLEAALASFREAGADVTGKIGDARPMEAIRDALLAETFDEIIVSTLPPGPSAWIRQDLPHRVKKYFALPVSHVVARREPSPA